MKKLNFRTQFTYRSVVSPSPPAISVTVPDMSFTIHEILARFTRGQSVPGNNTLNVLGDVSYISRLTTFEKIDLSRKLARRREVISENLERAKAESDELKRNQAFEAELQKRIEALPKPTPPGV